MEQSPRSTEFFALGHAGFGHYAGLETFPNPGVSHVEMTSDELTALCPVTNQPDLYVAISEYWPETSASNRSCKSPGSLPSRPVGSRSPRKLA